MCRQLDCRGIPNCAVSLVSRCAPCACSAQQTRKSIFARRNGTLRDIPELNVSAQCAGEQVTSMAFAQPSVGTLLAVATSHGRLLLCTPDAGQHWQNRAYDGGHAGAPVRWMLCGQLVGTASGGKKAAIRCVFCVYASCLLKHSLADTVSPAKFHCAPNMHDQLCATVALHALVANQL